MRHSFRNFNNTCSNNFRTWTTKPRNLTNSSALKNAPKRNITYTFSAVTKIGIGLSTAAGVQLCLKNQVFCEAPKQTNRIVGYQGSHDRNLKFDWNRFWIYLKPHIWYFIAAAIGALIVALLNIEIPHILSNVINVIAQYKDTKEAESFLQQMRVPALKLLAIYLGQSAFTFFYIYMLSALGEKIAYSLKADLFNSIIHQDIAFFDQHRTGEIVNRLTTDIQDFKSSFKQSISGGLRAVAQIVGSSISLVLISPQMTLVTLLCVPTVIAVGTVFGSYLRKTSRQAQSQVEKSTAVADEAIGNIRTVRAFAMEDLEKELFDSEAELAMFLNHKLGFGIGLFQAGSNLFLNGVVLSTLYMGGYLLSSNQLSAGQLMAFLMATQTIQRSLGQLSLLFGSAIRGISAGSRVFEYINMTPTMRITGGEVIPIPLIKGDIEFNEVTFAYPSRPQQNVLADFNLTIPAGRTVAIVGASGNGKSTIAALLEGFYQVNQGSITIDGHNIDELDPSWLRQNVLGFISQEPVLFGTTILENIRYGKPGASDEECRQAAKQANADEFINSFPNGYNTLVGERGATLSGGQKQRIAIARALLKDPAILILDEATSALDTESEKLVQTALESATKGRTVLVIAHRLSTIKNADIIVVLNQGKIVETGDHEMLMSLRGLYWSLVYQQQELPG